MEENRYVSLSRFSGKYESRIGERFILHPRNLTIKDDRTIAFLLYMASLL